MLRRLLKNWPYKLLALATAIVLTTYVHSERNPWTSTSVDARVQCMNLQEGFIAKLSHNKLSIALNGPKAEVEEVAGVLKSGEMKALVDLADLQPGSHNLPVQVRLPDGLAPNVKAQPVMRRIAVTVEPISSRTLPVQVRIKSPPPIGFTAGEPDISPKTATVTGGSSLVNSVARLMVIVDATPMKPVVDEYVAIKALDTRGNEVEGVDVAPDDAHVALKLVETPATKAVFIAPSIVGQPAFPYRVTKVTVAPSSVSVRGKPERLAGMSSILTDEIDITGATSDIVRSVSLHLPPGVETEGSERVKVTIRIVLAQDQ